MLGIGCERGLGMSVEVSVVHCIALIALIAWREEHEESWEKRRGPVVCLFVWFIVLIFDEYFVFRWLCLSSLNQSPCPRCTCPQHLGHASEQLEAGRRDLCCLMPHSAPHLTEHVFVLHY